MPITQPGAILADEQPLPRGPLIYTLQTGRVKERSHSIGKQRTLLLSPGMSVNSPTPGGAAVKKNPPFKSLAGMVTSNTHGILCFGVSVSSLSELTQNTFGFHVCAGFVCADP